MKRVLSWGGFALILALVLPALPLSWAGLAILLIVLFLFMPAP